MMKVLIILQFAINRYTIRFCHDYCYDCNTELYRNETSTK